jgi:hypothetical protein
MKQSMIVPFSWFNLNFTPFSRFERFAKLHRRWCNSQLFDMSRVTKLDNLPQEAGTVPLMRLPFKVKGFSDIE